MWSSTNSWRWPTLTLTTGPVQGGGGAGGAGGAGGPGVEQGFSPGRQGVQVRPSREAQQTREPAAAQTLFTHVGVVPWQL